MILAANPDATPEVQAVAVAGIHAVQAEVKKSVEKSAMTERIDQQILLFLRNPNQNLPRLKSSGAPAGPPI